MPVLLVQKNILTRGCILLLYIQATGDPYYLRVGQSIVEKLNAYARVPCGFAAVQDVRTGTHEDRYRLGPFNTFSNTAKLSDTFYIAFSCFVCVFLCVFV